MRIIKSIRRNFKIITSITLFLFTSLLVTYMLPKERKFGYDFHKGRRWEHEDLYAQFPFPLHKPEEQLKRERDSVNNNAKLCYAYNPSVKDEQINIFKAKFNKAWIKYSLKEFDIRSEEIYDESDRYMAYRELQNEYRENIVGILEKIYLKGIIQIYESGKDQETIILVKGNIAEEKDINEFYTHKTAYEFASREVEEEFMNSVQGIQRRYRSFIKDFDINRFLFANVIFDETTTENVRNSELEKISETEGLIEQSELIIAEKEFVTPEKYRALQSYKMEFEKLEVDTGNFLVRLGKLLLILVCFFVMFTFLYNFRREILYQPVKTSFILILVLIMIAVATAVVKYDAISYYVVPFTILPILIRTFYDERVALFIHINTILMAALIAPKGFEFVFLNIIAGIVAIFSLTNLYRRSRFLLSAVFVAAAYVITYTGIVVIQTGEFIMEDHWIYFRDFGVNGVLVLSSFLLIYIAEKAFGFLSDTTLMELADTNQTLLRKLSEVAPGTFQHSLQVANLAEAAIMKIGGNPLLIRTGALYHDIGKMEEPAFFIENQTSGYNPHDLLEFKDSAEKIISHVIKGEELAKKNKLPKPIIDFIRTHHGTTTVQYFYKSYIKKYPEREDEVEKFTYPGPKPFSKETAVLMMADAVEASSRSLTEYTEETIGKLVDRIVSTQRKAGQFDDADITFKDLTTVKEIFKTRLRNMYHIRISYPK